MTTFNIRFTNKCTFGKMATAPIGSVTPFITSAAGQVIPNPAYATAGGDSYTDTIIECTFLYLATKSKESPAQENEDIIEIIIGDNYTPSYTDKVSNIKDRFGHIIEAGPLEIISIKKYVGYEGKLHHYRLRTRKMKEC